MTKAIIYCRFSPQRGAEVSQSNETQAELCSAYCQEHGYEIEGRFSDSALSGGDDDKNLDPKEVDRPGLWHAIGALKSKYVLVVYRADRLARSVYLHEYITRAVKNKGARIEAVDGSRNGDSPEDVFVRQVMAAYSEMERKIIAARTKAAMLRYMDNGIAMSSNPPYGKQCGPDNWVVGQDGQLKPQRTWIDDPAELAVMQWIRMLKFEKNCSEREIVRRLNKDKVPCRRSEKWTRDSVRKIYKTGKGKS